MKMKACAVLRGASCALLGCVMRELRMEFCGKESQPVWSKACVSKAEGKEKGREGKGREGEGAVRSSLGMIMDGGKQSFRLGGGVILH